MEMLKNIPAKKIIAAVVVITVIILLVSFSTQLTKAFKRWFGEEEEEPVDYPDTPMPSGEVADDFDPTAYVTRLREVLKFLWDSSPRCDAYERLLDLSNPEFVMVCNEYKNTVGRTLRSDMDSMLYDGCNLVYNRYGVEVRERMDELNIIG